MAKYEIRLKSKEVELDNGKKFLTFKAVEKDGTLRDLKFTMKVKNVPTGDCMIVVDSSNINLDKNRQYPCYWVKAIDEVKEIEVKEQDLSSNFETFNEKAEKALEDIRKEQSTKGDVKNKDLPF